MNFTTYLWQLAQRQAECWPTLLLHRALLATTNYAIALPEENTADWFNRR
jgi:hypothetical protein